MVEKTDSFILKIAFSLLFFLFLFNRINLDVGFRLIPIYGFMLFVALTLLLQRQKSVFALTPFEKAIFPFYIFAIATSFWTYEHSFSLRFIFGITLVFTTYFTFRTFIANNLAYLPTGLDIGFKFFVILSFVNYGLGIASMNLMAEHVDFYGLTIEKSIPRMIGLNNDPNICAFSFLIVAFYFLYAKSKLSKVFLCLSVLGILLTLSRGGLVSFIVGFVSGFLVRDKTKDLKLLFYILVSVFLLTMFITFNYDLIEPFVEKRLQGLSSGAGRFAVWENALSLVVERPFLGYGIFSFREVMFANFNMAKFAHNTYVEVLLETGLIGLTLFLSGLFGFLLFSYNLSASGNDCRFLFPATCACLVAILGLSMYIHIIFWLIILLHSVFYLKRVSFESRNFN